MKRKEVNINKKGKRWHISLSDTAMGCLVSMIRLEMGNAWTDYEQEQGNDERVDAAHALLEEINNKW